MKKIIGLLSLLIFCEHTPSSAVTSHAGSAQKPSTVEPLLIKENQQVARLVGWVNSNPTEHEKLQSINISIDKGGRARTVKFGSANKSADAAAAIRAMQFSSDATVKERRIKIQFVDLPSATGSKLSQRVRTVTTCGGVASGG